MPHVILEHSADLVLDGAFLDALFRVLAAHPAITAPASLKLRATACDGHLLGTTQQSFAHATLLLLPGRDGATKSDLSRVILDQMVRTLPEHASLSVNLADLDPAYVKRVPQG